MQKKKYSESLAAWDDIEKELFTPEEIAASNLRVGVMVQIACARKEEGKGIRL